MADVFCLDCGARIGLDPNARVGQRLTCPHCRAELELLNASPLELDWAYDEPITLSEREGWACASDVEAGGPCQEVAGEKLERLG